MRLMEWLNRGGGAGETPHQLLHILANRTGFRAAVPLSVIRRDTQCRFSIRILDSQQPKMYTRLLAGRGEHINASCW